MRDDDKIDIGLVQVHKKVIGDIAVSALKDIDGVKLAVPEALSKFFGFFGNKNFPAVVVHIDKDNQLTVEIKVIVRYGMHVGDVSRQIQDMVRVAVERMSQQTGDKQSKENQPDEAISFDHLKLGRI